jgi:DNA-binding CsgD family transcriptional regulator
MPFNGDLTPDATLCEREREILTWVARGKTGKEIAIIMSLSPKTVHWYLARAKTKLKVVSIPQAIVAAMRTDQIAPGWLTIGCGMVAYMSLRAIKMLQWADWIGPPGGTS